MNLVKFFGLKRGIAWGMAVLLGCILAIGCNQDDECGIQPADAGAKKAEVMKLAEQYGVTYQLDENLSDKQIADLNLEELESFFQGVKNLTSKAIPLQFTKEGEAMTSEIADVTRLKTRAEEGSWSGSDVYYAFTISVTVSWSKLTDGQLWHTEVSSAVSSGPESYSYSYTQENYDAYVNENVVNTEDDNTIFFNFNGKLSHSKGSVSLHGAGALYMKSKTGSVFINSR